MGEPRAAPAAVIALLFNAFVWGVSWWPLRALQGLGVHPLWSTALVYAVALAWLLLPLLGLVTIEWLSRRITGSSTFTWLKGRRS